MKHIFNISILSLLLCLVSSCGDSSSGSSSSSSYGGSSYSSQSITGVYSYSGSDVKSTVTVSSSSWSGTLVIVTGFGESYDNSNASYSRGIVKGNDLYDESGYIKLGSANGSSLTMPIGSSTVTHYK